ncbi:TetR/AcrR family transcriptional regulator [Paenibacillus chibensis]|uniref:TetR/AcrR family transcriptional regulator n=1 Tax=Paenibacillus chibensis TaxID=59846 RepID=A0ABU6PNQ5_9BACL|nr:TetR/AcrR family transcriptional regulator [Paenibacillus chibensis]MEC0369393.1 TetR/AcrR family transcriptional regulator [Paenibacillus chibensis]MED5016002.1 TetR/AcrR family transcriptional regulator [Paenibacillus chibensis]
MPAVDRRKEILHAAAQSFALFGYKATTMDQVAKIANVGKGTIYTFFTNKEELFDEILYRVILEMKELAESKIRREETFFDNLYRVLDALLEFRDDHELFIKLSQEVRDVGTPKAREGLAQIERVILEYLEKEIACALGQGEIKPCDPQVVAVVMLKLYIALTSDFNQIREPLGKEEIHHYIRLFLADGLASLPEAAATAE